MSDKATTGTAGTKGGERPRSEPRAPPPPAVAAALVAVGALVTHSRMVAVAGAALALSTVGCYLLAVWIGLFGFKEIRTRAGLAAGLIEVAAFATLALAVAITGARPAAGPARPRVLAGMRAPASLVVGVVGAVSV